MHNAACAGVARLATLAGDRFSSLEALPLAELLVTAEAQTLSAHGPIVTYSRKVFIPLTRLCRDVCHYCTFAATPSKIDKPYLSRDEMQAIADALDRPLTQRTTLYKPAPRAAQHHADMESAV